MSTNVTAATVPKPGVTSFRKERVTEGVTEETSERKRHREGKTERETRNRGGGDFIATHITAAIVPKPTLKKIKEKRG